MPKRARRLIVEDGAELNLAPGYNHTKIAAEVQKAAACLPAADFAAWFLGVLEHAKAHHHDPDGSLCELHCACTPALSPPRGRASRSPSLKRNRTPDAP